MIAKDEAPDKLAAKPCADCAVEFDGELLDDDGICMWCELIRLGAERVGCRMRSPKRKSTPASYPGCFRREKADSW